MERLNSGRTPSRLFGSDPGERKGEVPGPGNSGEPNPVTGQTRLREGTQDKSDGLEDRSFRTELQVPFHVVTENGRKWVE